jgi:hypothetical protein
MTEGKNSAINSALMGGSGQRRTRKRRESHLGIIVTALACGGFLWWWFTPATPDSTQQHDPMFWFASARTQLRQSDHGIAIDYDLFSLARGLLLTGDAGAEAVASIIHHRALHGAALGIDMPDQPAEQPVPATSNESSAAASSPEEAVEHSLAEAQTAYNTLDFDGGARWLDKAVSAATESARGPAQNAAWARVAAAQFKLGAYEAAQKSMQSLRASDPGALTTLSGEIIVKLAETDAVAPCLEWLAAAPPDSDGTRAVVKALAGTIDSRFQHRESGELAAQSSRANPGARLDTDRQRRADLWEAVETDRLDRAGQLADSAPPGVERAAAFITIARALAWAK